MFQFGLRSMLFLTLSSAALFAVVFALPLNVGVPLLNSASRLLIPFFVAGVVYGRFYARAFCIGGLSWFVLPLLTDLPPQIFTNLAFQNTIYNNLYMGSLPDLMICLQRLFMTGLSGILAIVVRYLAQPKPSESEPTSEGAPAVASKDRLPSWLIPLLVLLLLIGGMIGWIATEPQFFNPLFPNPPNSSLIPPGFFGNQ